MASPLALAVFQSVATQPAFLYASIIPLFGGIGLNVYRSTALDLDDEWYTPVRSFLKHNKHDLLRSVIIPDDSMMFGEAHHSVYKLKGYIWRK